MPKRAPVSGRGGRLGDGIVIAASIRARLFGVRVLTLDADIALTPEEGRRAVDVPARRIAPQSAATGPARRRVTASASNGTPGGRHALGEAALRLESGAAQLAAARERMP